MPRLPTMRVIGSQLISTSWPGWVPPPGARSVIVIVGSPLLTGRVGGGRSRPVPRVVAGGQRFAVVPPLRFLVRRGVGDAAQLADQVAVGLAEQRGEAAAGRHVNERKDLGGKPGNRAADADAADVGAAADAVHPAAL